MDKVPTHEEQLLQVIELERFLVAVKKELEDFIIAKRKKASESPVSDET